MLFWQFVHKWAFRDCHTTWVSWSTFLPTFHEQHPRTLESEQIKLLRLLIFLFGLDMPCYFELRMLELNWWKAWEWHSLKMRQDSKPVIRRYFGADKQKVGQVASEIRAFRPPEPYKGKGVRYSDERVSLKEAKKK